jgi:endonuclease-3 related protein
MAPRKHRFTLHRLYQRLFRHFGPQHWWPGDTPVEVMAGAILTQNTNWKNVERAIAGLKANKLMSIRALAGCGTVKLAELIRSAGYYNVKAKRLNAFFQWFLTEIGPEEKDAVRFDTETLRRRMLEEVNGAGPETVDSILLYALNRPVFVIDAYTRRILINHGMRNAADKKYDELQAIFHNALPRDTAAYNEFHALLVACGKLCRKGKPLCKACPIDEITIVRPGKARRTKCAR